MKHLVIIDGHHLMYRAYWAIPRNMKNSKGQQVNAAFGVASMLIQILRTEQPDSLLFCFDAGDETFRHAQYAEYKSGRAETPDDFYVQIPGILSLVDAFGFARVEDAGYEADDFACAYARAAEKQGMRVTIISGDRDLLQLASRNIKIAIPHKGYQVPEYLGAPEVLKKYGVTPEQITSYKGLVGDSSDNLRGVKGIGPKAAAALLATYPTLEAMYEHLPEIKESWRTKLEADREQAFFCKKLSELVCDMPLPVSLADLAISAVPTERVLAAFDDLEFVLLRKRLLSLIELPYGIAHFQPAPASAMPVVTSKHTRTGSAGIDRAASQLSLL